MLDVSATQELANQLDAVKQEKKELAAEDASARAEIAKLKAEK
jgi:hypothetical protein